VTKAQSGAARGASFVLPALASLVPDDWRAELGPVLGAASFSKLEDFLAAEEREGNVFPPRHQIFEALARTPLEAVKAVVLGQDPYPTLGNANGLAFSVNEGVKIPASLKNLFLGLKLDLGIEPPKCGDLTRWAERGVLLLNTVLTVREGQPGSHRKCGWEAVTDGIVECVNRRPGLVVFLCFGAQAQAVARRLVDPTRHAVLVAPHPSPLNGHAFVRAVEKDRHFSRANSALIAAGREPVDWSLG
jgi:uracil-DNA glycosylase